MQRKTLRTATPSVSSMANFFSCWYASSSVSATYARSASASSCHLITASSDDARVPTASISAARRVSFATPRFASIACASASVRSSTNTLSWRATSAGSEYTAVASLSTVITRHTLLSELSSLISWNRLYTTSPRVPLSTSTTSVGTRALPPISLSLSPAFANSRASSFTLITGASPGSSAAMRRIKPVFVLLTRMCKTPATPSVAPSTACVLPQPRAPNTTTYWMSGTPASARNSDSTVRFTCSSRCSIGSCRTATKKSTSSACCLDAAMSAFVGTPHPFPIERADSLSTRANAIMPTPHKIKNADAVRGCRLNLRYRLTLHHRHSRPRNSTKITPRPMTASHS
mmetsp:Transcript_2117/g.6892  ORF Transcript_2117/g.6892 Transcript_2117/m.6892 type:complete len:345 (-) Transcript_2117:669-1703(-)